MSRPLVYDLTHLVHRMAYDAPSGIDRVDLAFGRHFSRTPDAVAAAVHYAKNRPHVWPSARLAQAVGRLEDHWRETGGVGEDEAFAAVKKWLRGAPAAKGAKNDAPLARWHRLFRVGVLPALRYARPKRPATIPQGSLYINVAQHAMENARFFDWLTGRPDMRAVFFLHDLLPLDFPEFWWAGHEDLFERRIKTMTTHASALLTSSRVVRDRAALEMQRRGRKPVPILAQPLPSPIEASATGRDTDETLAEHPYFVVVGTIEPRKNHTLLLNVWRDLAARGGVVPKLVVIGKRGWENDQAVALIERCRLIQPHILEVSGLSNGALRRLVANACALLIPSFDEGYGLPLVESLSLGRPVVASDIAVFREVGQDKAIFRSPIDGLGWRDAILALADRNTPFARDARALAAEYRPITTAAYFQAIDAFLADL